MRRMNMDSEAFKPILAGIARHALTTLGGILVSDGVIQSSDVAGFVGAGMVLAGIAWSWWQKKGQAQTVADLQRLRGLVAVAKQDVKK